MLKIVFTSKFKKEYKLAIKKGCDIKILENVISLLQNNQSLPEKYKEHSLSGKYAGYRECHLAPDWLLIYKIDKKILILTLIRMGSHSDLF